MSDDLDDYPCDPGYCQLSEVSKQARENLACIEQADRAIANLQREYDKRGDRIEALERENRLYRIMVEDCDRQRKTQYARAEAAEARLAKAMEVLRAVDDEYTDHHWGPELSSITQVRATLAEFEGGKDE